MIRTASIIILIVLVLPGYLFGENISEYKTAAESGDPEAQYRIGKLYLTSDGAQRDYMKALEWFRKAAEQGYAPAEEALR